MSGVSIVLCLVLMTATPGPEELVSKLGAPRYADREAAASALEKLGRSAISALKASRNHRDSEIRSRAVALLIKIEGSLLLQPTMIRLDFQDRPVSDILKEINHTSGDLISILPDDRKAISTQRISLQSDKPLPFWTAVDRICDSGGLQYSFAGRSNPNLRETSLVVMPGQSRPPGLMSDYGPFRVNLSSLHYQRDLTFGVIRASPGMPNGFGRNADPVANPPASGQVANEQFYLRLQIAAEPQLSLQLSAAAKVIAATDEQGQSLLLPVSNNLVQQMPGFSGSTSGPIPFQLSLKRPDHPGQTIRLLKGVIPLQVSTRKPDPLVVPLAGSVGKTFSGDDATLTIHDLKSTPNSSQSIVEFTVVPKTPRAATNPDGMEAFMMSRTDVSPMNLELIDATGKPIPWYLTASTPNGDDVRMTISVANGPSGTALTPVAVRYFGTIATTTEVPFEFKNVPMP